MDILDGGSAFSIYETSAAGFAPSTRTVSEVLTSIKRTFGDEAGVQLEDLDIIGWINDAQEVIVNRNKPVKGRSTANTMVGVATYSFPNEPIQEIDSLHYNNKPLVNVPFSQAEQGYLKYSTDEVGTPLVWWEWAGQFTLYPTPGDVGEIELYYAVRPTRVSAPTDLLGLPDKYYQQVLQYVLQQAYEMDEDWQASQAKAQQFDKALNDYAEEETTAQNMTFDTIIVMDDSPSAYDNWIY